MPKLPSLRKQADSSTQELREDPTGTDLQEGETRGGMNFSIKMLMMLTLVVAVAAAGWGGMQRGGTDRAFYVLFATAAPLLVLLVVGILHQLTRRR